VAEAIEESVQELRNRLVTAAKQAYPGEGWKAMVRSYLSPELCDHPDEGCPIAALAPDMARTQPALKKRIATAILKLRQEVLPFMPGRDAEEKAANFLAIFSSMIGGHRHCTHNARSAVRQGILSAVRNHLFESIE
jgi:TetR/AcrR family transcriptional regulator, transcriptional repressor for nem operon